MIYWKRRNKKKNLKGFLEEKIKILQLSHKNKRKFDGWLTRKCPLRVILCGDWNPDDVFVVPNWIMFVFGPIPGFHSELKVNAWTFAEKFADSISRIIQNREEMNRWKVKTKELKIQDVTASVISWSVIQTVLQPASLIVNFKLLFFLRFQFRNFDKSFIYLIWSTWNTLESTEIQFHFFFKPPRWVSSWNSRLFFCYFQQWALENSKYFNKMSWKWTEIQMHCEVKTASSESTVSKSNWLLSDDW
jgi:hypothetical protein